MQSDEIRSKFLKFFENRGHKIIPSSSLIPENDPSVLFTTAGMQQFKPYYINPKNADKDFSNRNIATIQKCIRTGDIDEVGDATHLTFFEMLGNFSFGGYGRKEAITYAHDFIIKELGLEISFITFYKGEGVVPRDEESRNIWKELGVKDIREDGSDVFWGPTGDSGPCGPTTEIYCKNVDNQDVEIWNIVFNEYFCNGSRDKLDKGEATLKKLDVLGVDTGMGFERLLSIVQKKKSVYETDLFTPLMQFIQKNSTNDNERSARIIADHIRTAIFITAEGVIPSNNGRGYVLRRLIRRFLRHSTSLKLLKEFWIGLVKIIIDIYNNIYLGIREKSEYIIKIFREEKEKFKKSFDKIELYRLDLEAVKLGLIKKIGNMPIIKNNGIVSGLYIYQNYQMYGVPPGLSIAVAKGLGYKVDEKEFDDAFKKHQELSRTASAGMFKGGLTEMSEETKKLHTTTHLLNAALRIVLGNHVMQKGSNITNERLRFDFTHPQKMTEEEKKKVEDIINEKISEKLPVSFIEMPKAEAEKIAAHAFNEKYGDTVKVYSVGDEKAGYFSREFCGGPHVANTAELCSPSREYSRDGGPFKIQKEEAVAQGIRRIKAVLM
ncbi:alanine--tRNA ligase [Patescibacteria group bacterium]|nr:alanine--tRNA ligase [Patescibacteria group bacterium]